MDNQEVHRDREHLDLNVSIEISPTEIELSLFLEFEPEDSCHLPKEKHLNTMQGEYVEENVKVGFPELVSVLVEEEEEDDEDDEEHPQVKVMKEDDKRESHGPLQNGDEKAQVDATNVDTKSSENNNRGSNDPETSQEDQDTSEIMDQENNVQEEDDDDVDPPLGPLEKNITMNDIVKANEDNEDNENKTRMKKIEGQVEKKLMTQIEAELSETDSDTESEITEENELEQYEQEKEKEGELGLHREVQRGIKFCFKIVITIALLCYGLVGITDINQRKSSIVKMSVNTKNHMLKTSSLILSSSKDLYRDSKALLPSESSFIQTLSWLVQGEKRELFQLVQSEEIQSMFKDEAIIVCGKFSEEYGVDSVPKFCDALKTRKFSKELDQIYLKENNASPRKLKRKLKNTCGIN